MLLRIEVVNLGQNGIHHCISSRVMIALRLVVMYVVWLVSFFLLSTKQGLSVAKASLQ